MAKDERTAADRLRVGFFPGVVGDTRWNREIHPWSALATDAIRAAGCEVVPIDAPSLCALPPRPELDVIHLNWPQSLVDPSAFKRRKYLPGPLYARWFRSAVDERMRALEAADVAVVWQVHDLPYADEARTLELLTNVFVRFFARADAFLFYERSAQEPVFELFGSPDQRPVGVAHLGGYLELHGPPVGRAEARARLGLAGRRRVFLYPGTVRWSRSPAEFARRFAELSEPEDLLIITGRGTHKLDVDSAGGRVQVRPGMIDHDEFRDLICASDFVINDAYRYLGSAILRVALGYGVPVIARSFGCTADIARGAYVEVSEGPDGLDVALAAALALPADVHRAMCQQALERDRERPWSAYGARCAETYRRALASRAGSDPAGTRDASVAAVAERG